MDVAAGNATVLAMFKVIVLNCVLLQRPALQPPPHLLKLPLPDLLKGPTALEETVMSIMVWMRLQVSKLANWHTINCSPCHRAPTFPTLFNVPLSSMALSWPSVADTADVLLRELAHTSPRTTLAPETFFSTPAATTSLPLRWLNETKKGCNHPHDGHHCPPLLPWHHWLVSTQTEHFLKLPRMHPLSMLMITCTKMWTTILVSWARRLQARMHTYVTPQWILKMWNKFVSPMMTMFSLRPWQKITAGKTLATCLIDRLLTSVSTNSMVRSFRCKQGSFHFCHRSSSKPPNL